MVDVVKITDFLKPSYEAIEKERKERERKQQIDSFSKFFDLLEIDGREISKSIIDFLADAFVDLADGAQCLEWEKQTENLKIYVNLKQRGKNE